MGVLLLLLAALACQAADLPGTRVEITVSGVSSGTGVVRGALWSSKAAYLKSPSDAFRGQAVSAAPGSVTLVFDALPPGEYAFSVFHDENENQQLDRGAFGIPKEAYGFSNNALGRMGPPSWDKASFTVPPDGLNLAVRLIRHGRGGAPGS
ncbi:MAG: DUF2141 domain-containing protein [Bryobacterales bacterium]|nr:DUF2141 domain-containing protein [Bryobacterales bacterium]